MKICEFCNTEVKDHHFQVDGNHADCAANAAQEESQPPEPRRVFGHFWCKICGQAIDDESPGAMSADGCHEFCKDVEAFEINDERDLILLGAAKVFAADRQPFRLEPFSPFWMSPEDDALINGARSCLIRRYVVIAADGNRCGTGWIDPEDLRPCYKPSGSTPQRGYTF